jgi:hypothetical protein
MAPTFQVISRTINVHSPTDIDDEQGQQIFHHLEHLIDDAVHKLTQRIEEYSKSLIVSQEK